jgi:dihydroorotate dehydrogenase
MCEDRMHTSVGGFALLNPIICGSGEHVMTAGGIRAALATGVAGVVAKSINESPAAARQLESADYAILVSDRSGGVRRRGGTADLGDSLFCRSGLAAESSHEWFKMLAALDREALRRGQFVAASIVLADAEPAAQLASEAQAFGIRVLELNIGAPHGAEASPGAITIETEAARIERIVAHVRSRFAGALWVKLGATGNPTPAAAAARRAGADATVIAARFMAMYPDLGSLEPLLSTSAAYGGQWALPITCRSLALTRRVLGTNAPLIGTNGARTGMDVARFLLAGACAVEMASAVFLAGFGALADVHETLSNWLKSRHLHVREIVGRSADAMQSYAEQPARPGRWRDFVPMEAR